MAKINIEVMEGKKPETEPKPEEIGKTQPQPAKSEVGGRAHLERMMCWNCWGISTIVVSDVRYTYYTCCFCGATNGPR